MPAAVVESGPAAGVIAAALAGRQLGLPDVISFDMGGTTAKASVIAGGEIAVTAEYEVGGSGNANRWQNGTGHPIRVPVIDLAEVSAGGGSIAWIDPGGSLRVGPHSAGADPGPAGYGAGGTPPTVTDADLVLGYLDRQSLLGGALVVDIAAAERAIEHARRPPARADGAGGGRADRRDRQRQHGRGAADRFDRTRPRCARVQPDRVRRRRAGACRGSGGGIANPRGHRPAGARRVLRAWPGRERSEARLRAHIVRRSRHASIRRVSPPRSPRWRRPGRPCWTPRMCRRSAARCRARPMCAIAARPMN